MDLKVGILGVIGYEDFYHYTGCTLITDIPTALKQDILIFSGGEDVSPELYGDTVRYSSGMNPNRDRFEGEVFIRAAAFGVKILGVCRGHQFVNAMLGGKLIQDIELELGIPHSRDDHIFEPNEESFWHYKSLANVFPFVNTWHHQAVKVPGVGQKVICRARDGIIESTTNADHSIVTFQFHPEWGGVGHKYFPKMMKTGKLIW